MIGTINAFTDPNFLDHCAMKKSDVMSLWVDFRGQESIHWKLYLIEPDTVIIGSANFTHVGLSLARDTCVVIKNKNMLKEYQEIIDGFLDNAEVMSSVDPQFKEKMNKYRTKHQRMQQAMRNNIIDAKVSLSAWLENEYHQRIKIFVWKNNHSAETKIIANALLNTEARDNGLPETAGSGRFKYRDLFTYQCDEDELPWCEGDIVLCFRNNGKYIGFKRFDRIIHHEGINYMYFYSREDKNTLRSVYFHPK